MLNLSKLPISRVEASASFASLITRMAYQQAEIEPVIALRWRHEAQKLADNFRDNPRLMAPLTTPRGE